MDQTHRNAQNAGLQMPKSLCQGHVYTLVSLMVIQAQAQVVLANAVAVAAGIVQTVKQKGNNLKKLIIATRGSQLALWQAEHIKACLESQHAGLEVELLRIKTKGDIILDVPLAKVGGKGLFVKEIEDALLQGKADLAVHSMKDVPMFLPAGLTLACIPEREITQDVFLSVNYANVDALPQGAHVGTSSLRRQAQLLALRPDLQISALRGNVDTRMRKLMEGQYDAIILAAAGVKRLGLTAPHMHNLNVDSFVPAVGQGALGIECMESRTDVIEALAFLEHRPTRVCVEAERAFLAKLEGGCQVPIAGYATLDNNDEIHLTGLVAEVDGKNILKKQILAPSSQAKQMGAQLATSLLEMGAASILEKLYAKS